MMIKIVTYLSFLVCVGIYGSYAQQVKSNSDGNSHSERSETYTEKSTLGKTNMKKRNVNYKGAKGKKGTTKSAGLYSESEVEARALTARKTKNSAKGNISLEEAKRQRAARIQAIINKNKKRKTSQSKNKH